MVTNKPTPQWTLVLAVLIMWAIVLAFGIYVVSHLGGL